MKFSKTLLAAGVALAAMVSPALAQEEAPKFTLSGNIGVFSDYAFRGVSQTNEDVAVQGGLDASYGVFYAGGWASNVDFGYPGTTMEYDLYAGLKPVTGPITWDLGVIYYGYESEQFDEPYTEFKVAPSFALGPVSAGLALYYSPEFFANTGTAWYYEANGSVPVGKVGPFSLAANGAIGYQDVELATSYTTWRLGLSAALESGVTFDLTYTGQDADFGPIGDDRFVFSVKYSFGLIE